MILTLAVVRRLTRGLPPDTRIKAVAGRPCDPNAGYRVYCDPTGADTTRYWVKRLTHYTFPCLVIYAEHLSYNEWLFRDHKPSNRLVGHDRMAAAS